MKVAKKVRLLSKDSKGDFIKNDTNQVLRSRVVIQKQSIEESEISYKETGILYIIDEEATKEWLEAKEQVKQPKKGGRPKKKEDNKLNKTNNED